MAGPILALLQQVRSTLPFTFFPADEETDNEQQVLGSIDNGQDLDDDDEETMDDDEILDEEGFAEL